MVNDADLRVRVDADISRMSANMKRMETDFDRRVRAVEKRGDAFDGRMAKVGSRFGQGFSSRQGRAIMGNVGQQFQDIAVQAQMGTDSVRIFSQQGPQIAGAFGPAGAVLGAFIAVAGLGITAFRASGDQAAQTKEKISAFEKSMTAANAAMERAAGASALVSNLDALEKKYGAVTDEIRDMQLALAEVEASKAQKAVGDALEQFLLRTENMAGVTDALDDRLESMIDMKREISALTSQLEAAESMGNLTAVGILRDQIADLNADVVAMQGFEDISDRFDVRPEVLANIESLKKKLDEAVAAGDFAEVASVLADLRSNLAGVDSGVFADVAADLATVESVARQAARNADLLAEAGASVDFKVPTDSARAMADEVSRAVDKMQELREASLDELEVARIRARRGKDTAGAAGEIAGLKFDKSVGPIVDAGVSPGEEAFFQLQRREAVARAEELARLSAARSGGSRGGGRQPAKIVPFDEAAGEFLAKEVDQLTLAHNLIGLSREAAARLNAEYATRNKLLDEARERNLENDPETLATIDAQVNSMGDLAESVARVTEAKRKELEATKATAAEQKSAAEEMQRANQQIFEGIGRAITQANSFKGALKAVALQLVEIAASGFFSGVSGGNGSSGGGLGSFFASAGSALVSSFGGFSFGSSAAPATSPAPTPRPFNTGTGRVVGFGTSISDNIPALVSRDEAIIRAGPARKYRNLLSAINSDRAAAISSFSGGGNVSGGARVSGGASGGSSAVIGGVTINNYGNANVTAERKSRGGGPDSLVVEIDKVTSALVGDPSSRLSGSIGNHFNSNRR